GLNADKSYIAKAGDVPRCVLRFRQRTRNEKEEHQACPCCLAALCPCFHNTLFPAVPAGRPPSMSMTLRAGGVPNIFALRMPISYNRMRGTAINSRLNKSVVGVTIPAIIRLMTIAYRR